MEYGLHFLHYLNCPCSHYHLPSAHFTFLFLCLAYTNGFKKVPGTGYDAMVIAFQATISTDNFMASFSPSDVSTFLFVWFLSLTKPILEIQIHWQEPLCQSFRGTQRTLLDISWDDSQWIVQDLRCGKDSLTGIPWLV